MVRKQCDKQSTCSPGANALFIAMFQLRNYNTFICNPSFCDLERMRSVIHVYTYVVITLSLSMGYNRQTGFFWINENRYDYSQNKHCAEQSTTQMCSVYLNAFRTLLLPRNQSYEGTRTHEIYHPNMSPFRQ